MDHVNQFLEFTGGVADRQTAIAFIRANDNDVQSAVMAYFDNPDPSRYKTSISWDESAFSSNREGAAVAHGPQNQSMTLSPSLVETEADVKKRPPPSVSTSPPPSKKHDPVKSWRPFSGTGPHHSSAFSVSDSVAPSRPPSRIQAAGQQAALPPSPPAYGKSKSSRLPLPMTRRTNRRHAANDTEVWDTRVAEYEGENEAIQRSLEDSASSQGEKDILEAKMLSVLDQAKLSAFGKEVVPDAEPSSRVRGPSEPAFLKPMVKRDFLPALITILHSVKSIRNTLLSPQHQLTDYGSNPNWWSGEDIQTSTIMYHGDEAASPDVPPQQPARPLEIELQRLMAFLDKTERSYGSADPLARVQSVEALKSNERELSKAVTRFMTAWDNVRTQDPLFYNVIHSDLNTAEDPPIRLYKIPRAVLPAGGEVTLHDVLDSTLWDKRPDGSYDLDNSVDRLASVVVLNVEEHSAKQLTVPAHIFFDRYMTENKSILEETNKQNKAHVAEIKKIDADIDFLRKAPHPEAKTNPNTTKWLDAQEVYKFSINYMKERIGAEDAAPDVKDGTAVKHLESILNKITVGLDKLNLRKDETKAAMKSFSTVLTADAPADSPQKPTMRYVLRGVATTSFRNMTVYSKHREQAQPDEKWWKMTYDTAGSSANVAKKQAERAEVFNAAGKGIDDTMLVYVRADMVSDVPAIPLPAPLAAFVDADNAALRRELDAAASGAVQMQDVHSGAFNIYAGTVSRRSSGSSTKVHLGGNEEDMDVSGAAGAEMDVDNGAPSLSEKRA